jgi:hypothetical protein
MDGHQRHLAAQAGAGAVQISEYSLTVGDDLYRVRRAVDESAPELTLDELLVGYPPILRAAWADLLAEEGTEQLTEKAA